MPAPYRPMTVLPPSVSQEVDLGLQLPANFDLQTLFPNDRLLRLHPNWFVSDFHRDDGVFTALLKDYVTEEEFPASGSFVFNGNEDELLSIKLANPFNVTVAFVSSDCRLKVRIFSADEVIDASDPLLLWIRSIKEYIRIYVKRTPVTLFFRFLMNRMMLQMDPSQRKICLMIAKITAVELLVIVLLVVGYVFFVL
ncbi:MAG: hypothetical protein KKD01_16300 [Proteobacteria bacterium]|nr:hypothetical protein [Pseudomonadota bacterium]MBU1456286.1 hypothetical protein [Pseudomonadota bacterium]